MLKVCLAGVGGISGAHIPCWLEMEETELVGICDIRPEQMEKYEKINKYSDIETMLDTEKPDILDICLPTYLHPKYAMMAIEKGINVISEKPVSLDIDDVDKLYNAAKENNVKFMIAQVLRFWPAYEYVKEIYDSKKYGKLLSGSMTRLGCYPKWSWDGWMMDEKRSGLVPFDLHIHDLDFLIYTFGDPKNVTTFRSKEEKQDFMNNIYEFDGFFISTEASWYASPYPFKAQFIFQFEDAVIALENGELKTYQANGEIIEGMAKKEDGNAAINLPKTDAYFNEIRYFTNCVLNDKPADKVKPNELKTVLKILKMN